MLENLILPISELTKANLIVCTKKGKSEISNFQTINWQEFTSYRIFNIPLETPIYSISNGQILHINSQPYTNPKDKREIHKKSSMVIQIPNSDILIRYEHIKPQNNLYLNQTLKQATQIGTSNKQHIHICVGKLIGENQFEFYQGNQNSLEEIQM